MPDRRAGRGSPRHTPLPVAMLVAVLAMPAASRAASVDRPVIVPDRDVDVVYAIPTPGGGAPLEQRMRFEAAGRLQRTDPPGNGLFTITDYPARTMLVVQPGQHAAMLIPAPGPPLAADGRAPAGFWQPAGTATVAGLSCTDWQTTDASGNPSTVCFTADGVLLRAQQNGRTILEARSVSEAPLDPSVFRLPPGITVRHPPTPSAP